ncbi:MAG: SusF/SusE family outer membrane protein [Bacteroidales bacterium]
MKRFVNYITFCLLLTLTFVSCEDNSNWKVLEEPPVGTYIVGPATIYTRAGAAAQLLPVKLDGDGVQPSSVIVGIYTYLKAGGDFKISHSTTPDALSDWGMGEVISSVENRGTTYKLVDGANGFTVPKDGVYYIVVNTQLSQLTILPVDWGVIGSATPNEWGKETLLGDAVYNSVQQEVTWTGTANIKDGEMKFRYSGDWGYFVDSTETQKAKLYTDLTTDKTLGDTYTEVSTGGPNITITESAQYEITLKLSIQTGSYSAKMVKTGDYTPPVNYPEKLYMVGDAAFGWPDNNWDEVADELIPVNGVAGSFWKIAYLKPGGFKFTIKKDWGGDFGINTKNTSTIGEYRQGGENINVDKEGYYQIFVNLADKKISIIEPAVYLIGTVTGDTGFKKIYEAKDIFTIDNGNKQLVSPAFTADGELRMAIKHPMLSDWWKAEFILIGSDLVPRGNGGDQNRLNVKTGQKAYLNFYEMTGLIK